MLLKSSEVLRMHHVFKVGHGTQQLAKESHFFRRFFGMKGKKLVPHHALEIMAMGKKVQCSMV